MNQKRQKPVPEPKRQFIMLGDSGAGKTALIQRYLNNEFYGQYVNTLGFDFSHKQYTSKSGKHAGK